MKKFKLINYFVAFDGILIFSFDRNLINFHRILLLALSRLSKNRWVFSELFILIRLFWPNRNNWKFNSEFVVSRTRWWKIQMSSQYLFYANFDEKRINRHFDYANKTFRIRKTTQKFAIKTKQNKKKKP